MIFVGDVGVELRLTVEELNASGNPVAVDISTATSMSLHIERPDKTVLAVTPTFVNTGSDGKVKYATVAGDLNQEGTYRVQWKGTIAGWTGRSSTAGFNVHRVLEGVG